MKISRYMFCILLALSLVITGCTKNKSIDPISRTEFLMDTVMTVKIYDKADEKILDKVFLRLEEIEKRMSATLEESDVNKINENAGIKPVSINEDTYFVISEAKHFAKISSGAYEPTIGPLVDLWNIKAEEKERDFIPTAEDIEKTKVYINYNNLELLDNNQVYLKEQGMKINLGSIVKGYATDEVRRILIENGVNSAIIDLGGNVFAHGTKLEETPWKIGIQDPFEHTGNFLGVIEAENKSIVTSGDYERFFTYKGKKYHHILDTKTGYPADNEITGVSIISDKSIDGDGLSTTLFVLGVDKGIELVNSLEGIQAIFVTKNRDVYIPASLNDKFNLNNGNKHFNIKEY
ncbi:FAD:protein FMN transferase [Tissierella pigra]|uniref:FAD:protein FMN transferase n=1 Tax=Tissierella pigra TaxID=2607614 RepID=A0A6N7Y324_9FIRM|nr:FAD:protein FMN transferase [Tissierella pigra]MSU02868.1 FAD:protein FMN transferase [Tissierella pigra]